jgi:ABC-type lipoprotein release transport system permease subunit
MRRAIRYWSQFLCRNGAPQKSILVGHVPGAGANPGGIGLITGIVAALRLLKNLLFGVDAVDAVSFAFAFVLLFLLTPPACYLPARRAIGSDPITALRSE